MKLRHLLPILPAVAILAGCGQSEIKLDSRSAADLAGPGLTAQPVNLVIYPDDRPSIPDGHETFQQSCASCHSSAGAGAPASAAKPATSPEGLPAANAAPGTTTSSFAFTQRWANSVKPVDIYKLIAFGENGHPKFSDKLEPRKLWNAALYARSIGQAPLTNQEIEKIDAVFGANCAVCHGTKGDGDGPLMRNLEPAPANFQKFDRFFNRTDDVLFDHIANGIRWEGMPNFLGRQDRAKGVTFDEAYIKKLVQYVRKFHVNNQPVMSTQTASATPNPAVGADQQQPGGGAAPTDNTKTR